MKYLSIQIIVPQLAQFAKNYMFMPDVQSGIMVNTGGICLFLDKWS